MNKALFTLAAIAIISAIAGTVTWYISAMNDYYGSDLVEGGCASTPIKIGASVTDAPYPVRTYVSNNDLAPNGVISDYTVFSVLLRDRKMAQVRAMRDSGKNDVYWVRADDLVSEPISRCLAFNR